MVNKFDYKKEYKDLYMPKKKPVIVDVPPMNFIMVDGEGDPSKEETLALMRAFMAEKGLVDETGSERKHHEIYLSDPRKTTPDKLKTVLRHPVATNSC